MKVTGKTVLTTTADISCGILAAACLSIILLNDSVADSGIRTAADASGPAQVEFLPPSGSGHTVILISGARGPDAYQPYAEHIAAAGYYAVMLDGRDILSPDKQGGTRLEQATTRARQSPHALPGKVGVIGFSQGGGGALAYATRRAFTVAVVVAYFPETAFIKPGGMNDFVGSFKVPVLAFAGGKDDFHDCCILSTIQDMSSTAKGLNLPFELVVYPNAKHDFIDGPNFRPDDTADAWRRTIDALHQHFSD